MFKSAALALGAVVMLGGYSASAEATVPSGQQIKQRTIAISQSTRIRGPIQTPVRIPPIRKPSPSGS